MKQQLLELIEEKAKSISNTPYHNKAFLSGAEYALTSPDILKAAGLVKEEECIHGYLVELSKIHNCHIDKIMLGMIGGDLNIWKYDEGSSPIFTQLEIISPPKTNNQ